MATWIEQELEKDETGETEEAVEQTDEVYAEVEEEPVEEVTDKVDEDDEELGVAYRGKSAKDIAKMHRELEALMHRQGNELSALRQQVANKPLAQPEQEPDSGDDDVDYFVDPKKAVSRSIENHEVIKEFKQATAQMKREAGVQKLQAKHPDLSEVINSEEFKAWCQATPVRQRLHYEADQLFSLEAADELISNFKELKGAVTKTKEAGAKARKSAVKEASTGNSPSNPDGYSSRKIFKRSELRRRKVNDPQWYEDNEDDILLAYAEGRVR